MSTTSFLNTKDTYATDSKMDRNRTETEHHRDALYCLLLEELFPQEPLLWWSLSDPDRSCRWRERHFREELLPTSSKRNSALIVSAIVAMIILVLTSSGVSEDIVSKTVALTLLLSMLVFAFAYLYYPTFHTHQSKARLQKTIYGLTNKRVICLQGKSASIARSSWIGDIESIKSLEALDHCGDVIIDSTWKSPGTFRQVRNHSTLRIEGVEHPLLLEKALQSLNAKQPPTMVTKILMLLSASKEKNEDTPSIKAFRQEHTWQATIWTGSSKKDLSASIVYGASLTKLRAAAINKLLELNPLYFSNGAPMDPRLKAVVGSYAIYSYTEGKSTQQKIQRLQPLPASQVQEFSHESDGIQNQGQKRPSSERRSSRHKKEQESLENTNESISSTTHTSNSVNQGDQLPKADQLYEREAEGKQKYWLRQSSIDEEHPSRIFSLFEEALHYFASFDMLPETGPGHTEGHLVHEHGSLVLQSVKTVKRTDDEDLVNAMLSRGGWYLLNTKGALAPSRGSGPIVYLLGHPEPNAV